MLKQTQFKFQIDTGSVDLVLKRKSEEAQKLQNKVNNIGNQTKKVSKTQKSVQAQVDNTRLSAQQMWTYGNQLASMFIQISSDAFEGTKYAAAAQFTLSQLQLVQQEYAVAQTGLQSAAFFASGNIAGGIALGAIAIMMQIMVGSALMNKLRAKAAQEQIQSYQSEVQQFKEAYN